MDLELKKTLLSLLSITVGFLLSQAAIWFSSRRTTTKHGKGFDAEIAALKPALKAQISSMGKFSVEIAGYKETEPSITVFKNVDFKQFDRHRVVQYYSRMMKEEAAMNLVNQSLQRVAIIEFDVDRFLNYSNAYMNKTSAILNTYRNVANQFKRDLAEHCLQAYNSGSPDKYAEDLLKKSSEVLNADVVSNIVPIRELLHKELIEKDWKNSTHKMHPVINRFNQLGDDSIMDMETSTHEFLRSINTLSDTLRECYNDLYNEKL